MKGVLIKTDQFIKLQSNGIVRYVKHSEIVYLKANDNYTSLVLNDLINFTICRTLQHFEIPLNHHFVRCHRSYLVNIEYVKLLNKRKRTIVLTTGEELPFSRSKARFLEEKLGEIANTN